MDLLQQLTGTQFSPEQAATWIAIAATAAAGFFGLQRLRKSLAEEIRRELQAGQRPSTIDIAQKPLDVREFTDMTPLPMHNELRGRVEELREDMNNRFIEAARASAESRGKIYDLLRDQGNEISALKATSGAMSSRVVQMDGKIDQVLLRLPRQ